MTEVGGRLGFPALPSVPGVYRFTLVPPVGSTSTVYVGESNNLARRMSNYRSPGPTQPTNQRMNARMLGVLRAGGSVESAVVLVASLDGSTLDFGSAIARRLAENAILIDLSRTGHRVENL
ncbi:MAG: GIY-YIG nuclease family protein [Acidimicrobiales bacterium]